jgi:IPT/TIG domain-containing protein/dockerin type I repeat protein/Ig-like domain-containing protein/PKD domain-containing protein
MKRTLQVFFVALMFVSTVSGAVTKKAKGETTKKLAPEASTEADQQGESKKTPVAAGLTHIPFVPTPQVLTGDESDPDLPQHLHGTIDKAEYLRLRDEYIGLLRGIDPALPIDLTRRSDAIRAMEHQVPTRPGNVPFPGWMPLGPSPVPNGQTQQFPNVAPVSGRSTCVVVDPTNSNKVYLGTAQGGVWRTLDGGATWTPIFDAAQSLAIGALALAPSNPTILYVGTGEPNNSADSYFGVGVYRIDNADTTATLVGPINPQITTGTTTALTYNCFNGRTISRILVNPTDPANIFVSTAAGVAGAAGNALSNTIPPLALRGVFRSANATAAAGTVTFQKIIVNTDGSLDNPGTGNTSIFDMVFEPGNANNLLVSTSGAATGGAIYRSINALAATPAFSQVLFPGFNGLVMHLAINKVGAVVTAYVASNEPSGVAACSSTGQAGRVRKSIDGGATWGAPLVAAEGYCGGQCSYDNPVGVDPNNANIVYIGGNARGSCSDVLKRSADGGTTFTRDDTGLHADSHGLFIDPLTVPSTVWFTNDGGVWKRQDAAAGTAWLNQNTNGLNTIQFVSLAVHPTDQFLTIGGTQDNGTEAMTASYGNWVSAESGDGGFALIDQSSTDTTNVTMYHTFFNGTNNFIGFDRTNLGTCLPPPDANKDSWEFRGGGFANDPTLSCDGTAFTIQNGINVADTVLFYAPMALGPGTPNTLYFGTNKLYRSTDRGDTMVAVSQNPFVAGVAVSAIGISPTNDNVRIVGLRNGKVFATTTGANPLLDTGFVAPVNATASVTNKHVARAVIDPLNNNTAYVTLAYYTNPSTLGQIWRTTNLNAASPTWTSIGNTGVGLPNVPVNGFVVDAGDPGFPGVSVLYAGTDIGVYVSSDSGATWTPFGNPLLPRVAVFDLVLQPSFRILRAATHGRGAWQIGLPGSSCVPVPPTPTITPSGATTFCTGGSVTLTSSSATGNQWYDGVTLLPGQTNQTYLATTSGNYNVVVTALCPSAHSASTAVTVNPLPATPTISGTLTFCTPGSTMLTSDSASGNQWYLGGDPLPGQTNQNYAATAAGSYTVQVTDGNGCVSAMSAPAVVTTNPTPPTPTVTPSGATTFCQGGSVTLTSSSASGNQWYDGATLLAGETNQTYVASTNGSYNVVVTALGCPSAPSANTPVTVNPLPGAPTISGTLAFCTGGNTTLSSDYFNGNQWYVGGVLIAGATNQTYIATAAGSYTVTVTDGNGCTSAQSAPAVVTVNSPPPTPTVAGTTNGTGTQDQACPEQPLTLTATSAGATSFQWYQDNNTLNGETNATTVVTSVGTYYVTATVNGCTSAQSTGYVVQNPTPHNAFLTAAGPTNFCAGGSVTLQSNSATGIQWYLDGNPLPNPNNQNRTVSVGGTYTVILNALGCHSGTSNSIVVTVNPLPATPTATPGGPTTFCAGGSVTLTSSSASGNQWFLNGNSIGGATNQTYLANASGSYTVKVTDGNSCTSAASSAVVVTVNPIPATPTITPGGPTTFCTGGSVTLTSSSASGNQWYLNGNPIGGATSQTYPANAAGSYTVTVTASGCTSAPSAATVVTVNPNPNATITAPASVTTSSTGNIASVANAGVGATYAWSVTGGTLTGGNNTPSITFTAGAAPGTLTINVTVTTSAGCSDAKSANVNRVLPVVTVTSVVPNFGTVTGGTSVTINGTNFATGATVTFGGTAATNVVVVTSIKITAKTPAHAAGAVNVTVTNTDTSNGTLTAGYLYQAQVFDPNGDGVIDPADIFFLINYLFTGGPAPHGPAGLLSGDANGDGVVDPADIFYLVNYLFLGGQKPNRPTSITDNPRAAAVGSEAPEIAGSIALGKPVLRAGHYFVPVVMISRGSVAPQSMSLKLHVDGDAAIGDVIVRRAGAAKDVPTVFETSRRSGNDVSYLVAYDPRGLSFDASRSAVVAEIEIAGAGANMTVSIDPLLTMLSNQGGTSKATVANGHLEVRGTAAAGDSSPRPRTPGHEVN